MTAPLHLHLISDSTGETLQALARAALAPFEDEAEVRPHLAVFVRGEDDLAAALAAVRANPGPIWLTMVNPELRERVEREAAGLGVECLSILAPLVAMLERQTGRVASPRPGLQHRLTDGYFDRVAALDYAISHDDGALGQHLLRADVIVTGISRTSKTPTCIYLAYRGVKAANLPLVPDSPPPPALLEAMAAGIPTVGLIASPSRLSHMRGHRLERLGSTGAEDYADLDRIRAEVGEARLFFQRHGIHLIDVTRRSIEETAAEILAVLRAQPRIRPGTAPGPSSADRP